MRLFLVHCVLWMLYISVKRCELLTGRALYECLLLLLFYLKKIKAKENWTGEQCGEIEENLRKNNSKRAYQLAKDLTTVKQGK